MKIVWQQTKDFVIGGEKTISIKSFKTMMKHLRKKINLYDATPHVLRHSYLTMLASNGIDMKTIQAIAGHAEYQTTMNIYVHPSMSNIQNAGRKMDDILHGYANSMQ